MPALCAVAYHARMNRVLNVTPWTLLAHDNAVARGDHSDKERSISRGANLHRDPNWPFNLTNETSYCDIYTPRKRESPLVWQALASQSYIQIQSLEPKLDHVYDMWPS